jgi:hypothetical protein
MPCPFFFPVARLDRGDWIHAPRLPLGDPYRGVCHAIPAELFEPPESDQRELCNCGYARGKCGRIPLEAPDAVRFSVVDDSDGRLKITWVVEKDHMPLDFGIVECAEGSMAGFNALLAAQADAFVRSYRGVIEP